MMRPRLALLSAMMLWPAVVAGAQASPCARFAASNIDATYDPLGAQATGQVLLPVQLRVARGTDRDDSSAASSVTAQFVDETSSGILQIGNGGPIYTIVGTHTVVIGNNGAPLSPTNSFTHSFTGRGTGLSEQVYGLQFIIDPGQDVPAGVYTDSLAVQYSCDSAPADLQSGVLNISVDVPSKLIASLSGGSEHGTLNFGDFSSPTQTALVNVYTTGPYALSVQSDNNQTMKLAGAPAGAANAANTQIGYSITFNGQPISSGATLRFGRTGIGGAQLPLAVTTEAVHGKRAGVYHDSLTLTFTPLATL